MLSALRRQLRGARGEDDESVRRIEYRNLAPLYAGEPMRVCLRRNTNAAAAEGADGPGGERKWDVWVEGPDGGLAVKGVAVSAAP